MCGIFGISNYGRVYTRREIVDVLLKGLARLEYRGYDSAGIAIDGGSEKQRTEPLIFKEKGNIAALTKYVLLRADRDARPCTVERWSGAGGQG